MKLVFASDSFKGTLSQKNIIDILTERAGELLPKATCVGIPVADGGEGTVEALVDALGGTLQTVTVHGPRMESVEASYGELPGGKAIIEMAAAAGLPLVPEENRNPLHTTSYGFGELILDALNRGNRDIIVGLGGSSTNDGGMGALRALGFRFFDASDNELKGYGRELLDVARINAKKVDPRIHEARFTVMCDVTNPLVGENGATFTFGPQKGANVSDVLVLEDGMRHYAKVCEQFLGRDIAMIPGTGAAGGLGAAMYGFLQGTMKSGIQTVLDLVSFDDQISNANYVITGEGRLDGQSVQGKVISGVAGRCKSKKIPCIAIVGCTGDGWESILSHGVTDVVVTSRGVNMNEALVHAEHYYRMAADRVFDKIRKENA